MNDDSDSPFCLSEMAILEAGLPYFEEAAELAALSVERIQEILNKIITEEDYSDDPEEQSSIIEEKILLILQANYSLILKQDFLN